MNKGRNRSGSRVEKLVTTEGPQHGHIEPLGAAGESAVKLRGGAWDCRNP